MTDDDRRATEVLEAFKPLAGLKMPIANDRRPWTEDDDWLVCPCGSSTYRVMKRDGLCHVLCAKCEADHTINVWEPEA